MATVTKNVLTPRSYQVWTSANMTDGDVLGVYESLGGRNADSVTLESLGGASEVKFNVVVDVYREHGQLTADPIVGTGVHNQWVGAGAGIYGTSPYKVTEIEDTSMPSVIVSNGTSQTWTSAEIVIRDIKLVTQSGLRITVT